VRILSLAKEVGNKKAWGYGILEGETFIQFGVRESNILHVYTVRSQLVVDVTGTT